MRKGGALKTQCVDGKATMRDGSVKRHTAAVEFEVGGAMQGMDSVRERCNPGRGEQKLVKRDLMEIWEGAEMVAEDAA